MGGDEVNDGGEVLDGTEAAGFVLHGLDDSFAGLGGAVGDEGPEVGHDALPVVADGLGALLHFRNPRTSHPAALPLEVPLVDGRVWFLHDVAQAIQWVEGLACLELSRAHPLPGPALGLGEAVLALDRRPPPPLEFLRKLPAFPASDLVEGVADLLHDVEVVEDQQRAAELLRDTLDVGRAHVRADRLDLLRGQPTATQGGGKVPETPAVPSLHGQEDTRRTPVLLGFAEDRQVVKCVRANIEAWSNWLLKIFQINN